MMTKLLLHALPIFSLLFNTAFSPFSRERLIHLPLLESAASQGITELISRASNGDLGNNESISPSLSADGRFVAFYSTATNLVTEYPFRQELGDVYVQDRLTHQIEKVSVASNGAQGNHASSSPSISADGRYVAFTSSATNLVASDTNERSDIFVFDRQTRQTEIVSVNNGGVPGNGDSGQPSISADGRFVTFFSWATNLVPYDSNGFYTDIYVFDRQSDTIQLVSQSPENGQANNYSVSPKFSSSGRYIVYASKGSNLVTNDLNDEYDIFLYDRQLNTTELISVAQDGGTGNGYSSDPSVSSDGRFVSFISKATNLTANDSNGYADVFVRDRTLHTTELVSKPASGSQANNSVIASTISMDGRYVAFQSFASNLISDDTNNWADYFLVDRVSSSTQRISVASDGSQGISDTTYMYGVYVVPPSISADNRVIAFSSDATNLVAGDTNQVTDVFVRDLQGTTDCVSPNTKLNVCNLQRGDILLYIGNYPIDAQLLRMVAGTYWFHAAIYLGLGNVAEAAGPNLPEIDQVRVRSIYDTAWWKGGITDWVVLRPSADAEKRNQAAAYAEQKANQENPAILYNTDFLNKSTESKFYCSQLVWKAYQTLGIDLEVNQGIMTNLVGPVVTPDDLFYSIKAKKSSLVQDNPTAHTNWRTVFRIFSPGDLLLTDPQGRRAGTDPVTKTVLNEIPGAYYTGPDTEPEAIFLFLPGADLSNWTLTVNGTGTGTYTLEASSVGMGGAYSFEKTITGTIVPGQEDSYPVKASGLVPELATLFLPVLSR